MNILPALLFVCYIHMQCTCTCTYMYMYVQGLWDQKLLWSTLLSRQSFSTVVYPWRQRYVIYTVKRYVCVCTTSLHFAQPSSPCTAELFSGIIFFTNAVKVTIGSMKSLTQEKIHGNKILHVRTGSEKGEIFSKQKLPPVQWIQPVQFLSIKDFTAIYTALTKPGLAVQWYMYVAAWVRSWCITSCNVLKTLSLAPLWVNR